MITKDLKLGLGKIEKKLKQGDILGNIKLGKLLGVGGICNVFSGSEIGDDECLTGKEFAIKIPKYHSTDFFSPSEFPTESLFQTGVARFTTGSVHYSDTYVTGEIHPVLLSEFLYLTHLAKFNNGIFPVPVAINIDPDKFLNFNSQKNNDSECHTWYSMEKLDGVVFRKIIGNSSVKANLKIIKSILVSCVYLSDNDPLFFHGDLKPENVIVKGKNIHLIDPVPRILNYPSHPFDSDGAEILTKVIREVHEQFRLLTIQYNPFAFSGTHADTLSLSIMILEVLLKSHPFRNLLTLDLHDLNLLNHLTNKNFNEKEINIQRINKLGLELIKNQLPASVSDLLLSWILSPPATYEEMLRHWSVFENLC